MASTGTRHRKIILTRGKEKSEFIIPLAESLRMIEDLAIDSPDRSSYFSLSKSLAKTPPGDDLTVAFRSYKRSDFAVVFRLVAALLDQELGSAKCSTCDSWVDAKKLQKELWNILEPLAGGGGRTYKCTCGHTVLKIADWRS